jgi:hypothetical protein
MCDLITGDVPHAPRPRTAPVLVSIAVHGAVSFRLGQMTPPMRGG